MQLRRRFKTDGTAQCWGSSHRNRITLPTNDDGSAIVLTAIDSQFDHAFGIRADNGGAVCWGWDAYGQVTGDTNDVDPFVEVSDYSAGVFEQISAVQGSRTLAGHRKRKTQMIQKGRNQ